MGGGGQGAHRWPREGAHLRPAWSRRKASAAAASDSRRPRVSCAAAEAVGE